MTTASWNFLILIGPLAGPSQEDQTLKEDDFKFCYRRRDGCPAAGWTSAEGTMQDFKNNIIDNLNMYGKDFLSCLLQDVYWGWERFLAQATNDVRGVHD